MSWSSACAGSVSAKGGAAIGLSEIFFYAHWGISFWCWTSRRSSTPCAVRCRGTAAGGAMGGDQTLLSAVVGKASPSTRQRREKPERGRVKKGACCRSILMRRLADPLGSPIAHARLVLPRVAALAVPIWVSWGVRPSKGWVRARPWATWRDFTGLGAPFLSGDARRGQPRQMGEWRAATLHAPFWGASAGLQS